MGVENKVTALDNKGRILISFLALGLRQYSLKITEQTLLYLRSPHECHPTADAVHAVPLWEIWLGFGPKALSSGSYHLV